MKAINLKMKITVNGQIGMIMVAHYQLRTIASCNDLLDIKLPI